MSLAGLNTFCQNLRTLQETEAYKKADKLERMSLGLKLLRSKYGVYSFGKVKKLDNEGKTKTEPCE